MWLLTWSVCAFMRFVTTRGFRWRFWIFTLRKHLFNVSSTKLCKSLDKVVLISIFLTFISGTLKMFHRIGDVHIYLSKFKWEVRRGGGSSIWCHIISLGGERNSFLIWKHKKIHSHWTFDEGARMFGDTTDSTRDSLYVHPLSSCSIFIQEMHVGKLWILIPMHFARNPCRIWRSKPGKCFYKRNSTTPSTASTWHFRKHISIWNLLILVSCTCLSISDV